MIKSTLFALLFLTFSLAFAQSGSNLANIIKKVTPSIVSIQVEVKPDPYTAMVNKHKGRNPSDKLGRIGSGVIFNAKKGYIATNAHVVINEKNMQVKLKDGSVYTAKLIGLDQTSDIAVIQIKANDLQALTFGNSNKLQVGDKVVAIGSPFGLTQTVTSGIVSALQRNQLINSAYDDFIQTDAPINPGNSGGALVDMAGNFVGMNTAIVSPEGGNVGIGFAIPSNIIKSLTAQLIKYGKVERGLVGLTAQDVTPAIANTLGIKPNQGALVGGVNNHSPAAESGVHKGDVITQVDGMDVNNSGALIAKLGLYRVGTHVTLTVIRNGDTKHINTELASPKAIQDVLQKHNPYFGSLFLQNISEKSPMQGTIEGVKIIAISNHTNNASLAGLQLGDIILSVNNKPVSNIKELEAAADAAHGKPLLINILHKSQTAYFVLKAAN